MKDIYRIIQRAECRGSDPDNPWDFMVETILWSGEDLPTNKEQERSLVKNVELSKPIPYDVAPDAYIAQSEAVLQELKLKKIGSGVRRLVWRDYVPQEDDESGQDHYYWTTPA
jgi:hypothetical protein